MQGSELTAEVVLHAYRLGAFAMGEPDDTINWYRPHPRCIIPLNDYHVPTRLLRTYLHNRFEIRIDSNFSAVIAACAEIDTTGNTRNNYDRQSTWISKDIIRVYTELFEKGYAHSVEAYSQGQLVGGLYGVSLGAAFMGESMFHQARDASKICLVYLIDRLKLNNYQLLDCQYLTNHLKTFGAIEIAADEYMHRLSQALKVNCSLT